MEKEILEYRKASAEWMGFIIFPHKVFGESYGIRNADGRGIKFIAKVDEWLPNELYGQMGMIEDKLIGNGYDIKLQFEQDGEQWLAEICVVAPDGFMEEYHAELDKSKPIAFMKAFMEYYNQNNDN